MLKHLIIVDSVSADPLCRSLWVEGEDLSSRPHPGASQHPMTVHRTPPLTSADDGAEEQSKADCFSSQHTQDHRSASNRTNPQEHSAPT